MAIYDDIIISYDGALALDNQDTPSCTSQKQDMLFKELEKFNNMERNSSSYSTRIITTILDEISNNLDKQAPGHNMTCHAKSHTSTGGGTGFGRSYDKRC